MMFDREAYRRREAQRVPPDMNYIADTISAVQAALERMGTREATMRDPIACAEQKDWIGA